MTSVLPKLKAVAFTDVFLVFLLALTIWMLQTKTVHDSWNESSRLAAIESLVERGTWRIDASPYGHETGDKMVLNGHYYSEKPPLFAAIGAVVYGVLHFGLGATLAIDGCQPGAICVYYWLTVLMVGVPSALMIALFYRLASRQIGSPAGGVGLTILLGLGTIVWPYSLVLNHHLPAAIALFISFYLLFDRSCNRYRMFGAGLLVGIAVMLDLTAVFLALALFLIVVIYHRNDLLFFIGAALIPVIATIIFNYQITGGVLFAYFSREGYNFPGSPWDATVGGQHPPDNLLLYAFRSLVGDHGLFGYSPLLLFALAGLIRMVRKINVSRPAEPASVKSALILLGMTGHLLFVLTRTNHFGGDAYGWRFFIPLIPTLYFFTVFVVPSSGNKWVIVGWGVAALVSLFSAYQGVQATWHQVQPPFFAALRSNAPYITIDTNLGLPDNQPTVRAEARPVRNFDLPAISHRLEANFNNELILLGYDLPRRRVEPGQSLELTLYWQASQVVRGDYFVFTHLLDADQTRQGGLDRRLQEGYPIELWYPGEIIEDWRQIPVEPGAANGLVWLWLGGYQLTEQGFEPLPLVVDGRKSEETSLTIGPILIGSAPHTIDRNQLTPQTSLAIALGEPAIISLPGYDMTRLDNQVQLTLYWESVAPTDIDYTVFIHLRDEAGKILSQVDQPPAKGEYPTSLWAAGDIISDSFTLNLPSDIEPGVYQPFVGLYNPNTGIRLAVEERIDNDVPLAKIEVK